MLVDVLQFGLWNISGGTLVRSVCRKPVRSPSADSSGAPEGGATRSLTAVSSIPCAITEIFTLAEPESHAVRFVVPYSVAPVPYIIRSLLKGSIAKPSVIHPSFGVSSGGEGKLPKDSHGEADTSRVSLSTRFG